MRIALIGNQNCGKTTLFNQLTGSRQHVGNFPGVTVDKKEGPVRGEKDMTVVDLPGIYSLTPYSAEEVVTRDFLIDEKPDCILNILDATTLERNLYLTTQLMDLQMPMILALNMMDEVRHNGTNIDTARMEEELGFYVVPISASKNEGIAELIEKIKKTVGEPLRRRKYVEDDPGTLRREGGDFDPCRGSVHTAVHTIAHLIEDNAKRIKMPVRFAAVKLLENDELVRDKLALTDTQQDIVGHLVEQLEQELGTDREAAVVDMRYDFIEALCKAAVVTKGVNKNAARALKIDKVLTHRIWAIPIFLGIMGVIFWLTFGVIGAFLSDGFAALIDAFIGWVDGLLTSAQISEWLHSLICDGALTGIGSVLSFLPTIVLLFFFLSILEDSGYMARVAFVMDKLLRKIGLSGRSFVPMLIGFGCSVPAVMATRTLTSERDRKMTTLLVPFMSCSAKLTIYGVFTQAFFPPAARALVMISLYVIGMAVGILYGLVLKKTVFKGDPIPFVLELPAYRLPSAKSVLLHIWDKAKDFLVRAFTIIFLASLVIWFLQSFDLRFNWIGADADKDGSILATIGKFVAPVFSPLGFGDWRAVTALITGLSAKETVVSTLTILLGVGSTAELVSGGLAAMFTPFTAFCFLLFTLLYMPCVATMAAVRRETRSLRWAALAMLVQTGIAYLITLIVCQVGLLFGL